MLRSNFHLVSVAAAALSLAGPANASLIGDTVSVTWEGSVGLLFGPTDVVVTSGGPEVTIREVFPGGYPRWNVDFRDGSVRFDTLTLTQTGISKIFLRGLDDVGGPNTRISGIQLAKEGIIGLDASDITFTDDSITIDVSVVYWIQDLSHFEVTFSTSEIPEPSTATLVTVAVTALAGYGRSTRRRSLRRNFRPDPSARNLSCPTSLVS